LTLIEDVRMDERFSYGVFSASQEGTLVYQTGKAQTRSTMTWMDRSGKPLGVLGEPTQYFNGGSVQISPDGKQTTLAVVNPDTACRISIWPIWPGEAGPALPSVRPTVLWRCGFREATESPSRPEIRVETTKSGRSPQTDWEKKKFSSKPAPLRYL